MDFADYETGEPASVDGFNLMLPFSSDVARIVLKEGHGELAVRTASPHSPAVTVTSPNGGESWSAAGPYTVTWTGSDADGDSLTYSVLYSARGSSWAPLATMITRTHASVNTVDLAGGEGARIRVLASDGFNNASDDSDGDFAVGKKPPSAYIISPKDDTATQPGLPLLLQGYAFDLEDGPLEGGALQWTSNQDGVLGTDTAILSALSSGHHVVTLEATDRDNTVATAAVNLFVGDRIYLPIVLRAQTPLADHVSQP